MVTTRNDTPRLLDLTRLVSRAGRTMTGVDRVEYAYLQHLRAAGPLFGLVRSSLGYVLLDPEGCRALEHRLRDGDFGPADRLSWLKPGLDPMRARAEAALRRICRDRCLPRGLARMLRRHLPDGTVYLNTGHTNLTARVLSGVRRIPGARVAVFVHDTIPLDHPRFQRPGTVTRFAGFLAQAGRSADVILCNSHQTARDLARHLGPGPPRTEVAPLGVPRPVAGHAPSGPWAGRPYFVTLGTIEPRKNHALLLDIWPDVPEAHLLVIGSRGWENHATFARLDAGLPRVHELTGLPDAAVFALLKESAGLLFPSLAEGYGLPPVEAAALDVPVVCNDLAIYREVLGDIPVYADVGDRYLWRTIVGRLAKDHGTGGPRETAGAGYEPPDWDAHFKAVLTSI